MAWGRFYQDLFKRMNINTSWFQDKKITVMGLGLHGGGLAVSQWLLRHGAEVIVTDMKSAEKLQESLDKLQQTAQEVGAKDKLLLKLNGHSDEDFVNVDMVIKNPGVRQTSSFLKIARENNIPVVNEASLFMQLVRVPVIGITGSKGKSTTTALIGSILEKKYPKTLVAGNIKTTPLFAIADDVFVEDSSIPFVVVELSSWHLDDFEEIKISPSMAVITNLFPEHLNSYDSFDKYIESKFNIVRFQKTDDVAILNFDDLRLRSYGKKLSQKVIWFSIESSVSCGVQIIDNKIVWHEQDNSIVLGEFNTQLYGKHNKSNIAAAVCVTRVKGVGIDDIVAGISEFSTLTGRMEYVGNIKERDWYNDTTATAPVAVEATLQSFEDRIVLIAGGSDKQSPVDALAQEIIKSVSKLILLPGEGTDKLVQVLEKNGFSQFIRVATMQEAVKEALSNSTPGQSIVLSPGFASFATFTHEYERGYVFVDAVKSLLE